MKSYRPTTPSRRHMTTPTYRGVLTTSRPHKKLTKGFKRSVGRNHHGRITTRHKGAGAKRRWRVIDFTYDKIDIPARVETIEYDPNRTAFIALLLYRDGERRYVVAPQKLKVGDEVVVSATAPIRPGNRLPLASIPIGTFVYNIEVKPQGGAKLVRSAGNYAEIIARDGGYVNLKLPSSEVRKVHELCFASIGEISNAERKQMSIGKAGRARKMGRRPTVRGNAMNPVDHPHGGGEGRQGRGHRRQRTVYGKPAGKGQKTRKPKKYSNKFILSRRVNKKRK